MRFLFVTWDAGGNVAPTLSLARRLTERGHFVRILGSPSLRLQVEAAGCCFAPYERVPNGVPAAAGTAGMGRLRAALLSLELARSAPALAFAADVLAELDRAPADACVVDFMLAGAIAAAERAGVPTAALMHTLYCLPVAGRPPFGFAFEPRAGPVGRLRDAAVSTLRRRAGRRALSDLIEARRRIGLAPASAADQLARLARVLVLASESFDPPPRSLPPNVRYIGPQLDGSLDLPLPVSHRQPLVVVSFSTRFAAAGVVQRVLDALENLRVHALLTLGSAVAPEDLRVPGNVVARRFLAHGAVLPRARLAVTHAGLGTVTAALAHGVPLLCIPLKNDQFENGARVVAAGAGLSLSRRTTRGSLRRAILQLLNEPQFTDAAGRAAIGIAAEAKGRALDELETLVEPRAADAKSSFR